MSLSEPADETVLFEKLESEMASHELIAELSEWMGANVHRVSALARICGWWKTQMREQGYSDTAIEEILPMMIERVWPTEFPNFHMHEEV